MFLRSTWEGVVSTVCYDARDALRSRRKLLSVLFAVTVFFPMLPAGSAHVSGRLADQLAPTRGLKSAEEIDREWRVSVAKYDAKRNPLIADAKRQSHHGPYRPGCEMLRNFEIPQCYKAAKFGIFINWGVYADLGAINEWFPRNMYRPGIALRLRIPGVPVN